MRALAVAGAACVLILAPLSNADAQPDCGPNWTPSLAQLQTWAREYYPGLTRQRRLPARIAIGFLFDRDCRIVRHSAGLWDTAQAHSEHLLLSMFPDLEREGDASGIADAVPPRGAESRYLIVVWTRLRQRPRTSGSTP